MKDPEGACVDVADLLRVSVPDSDTDGVDVSDGVRVCEGDPVWDEEPEEVPELVSDGVIDCVTVGV